MIKLLMFLVSVSQVMAFSQPVIEERAPETVSIYRSVGNPCDPGVFIPPDWCHFDFMLYVERRQPLRIRMRVTPHLSYPTVWMLPRGLLMRRICPVHGLDW